MTAVPLTSDPVSRSLPRQLRGFRGYHAEETLIVCGCGHSLASLPDPDRWLTVGVNDVGRLFDPTYLVVLNPRNQFKGDRFRYVAGSGARAVFSQLDLGLHRRHSIRFRLGKRGGTDLSADDRLPYTRNSPYVALCLAAFMGAKRIGLIGVDFTDHHFFARTGRHPLTRELPGIDKEYGTLAKALAKQGVEVVNLSAESRLESLPKVTPQDFLHTPRRTSLALAPAPARDPDPSDVQPQPERPLRIVQIAKTHCAGAIWRLHDAIARYTPHSCRTVTPGSTTQGRHFPTDLLFRQVAAVRRAISEADVVHFHNFIDAEDPMMRRFRHLLRGKTQVLQYHTEPSLVSVAFRGKDVVGRSDIRTLVVAQKQARFYPHSRAVPNILDIHQPHLLPDDSRRYRGGPLKLIYTPTDRKAYPNYEKTCCGKGYRETLPILKRLEKDGVIELTLVESMRWEELMPLKRQHDVVIDEVVTGGYHMASLEGLSQGLVTIAHLDDATRQTLHDIVGEKTELPWYVSSIQTLEADLRRLHAMGAEEINALKKRGRQWMEDHWDPKDRVQQILDAYDASQPLQRPRPCTKTPRQTTPRKTAPRKTARHSSNGGIDTTFKRVRMLPVYRRPPTLNDSLRELRNAWRDRQVVIWGNGPSAREAPEVWHPEAAHIGVNAAWPNLRDSFDAYCISDQRFVEQPEKRKIAERAPGVRIYLAHMRDVLSRNRHTNYIKTVGRDGFCSNLERGAFHGLSVVWVALQVAVWTGSRDILLVGCEHHYEEGRLRCYREQKPSPVDERNWPIICDNYRRLHPILQRSNVSLRTVGPSRLQEAGVPQLETKEP